MWSQGEPGGTRGSQEEPGGARRSQGDLEAARRSQEKPGEARRIQEDPGGPRALPSRTLRRLADRLDRLGRVDIHKQGYILKPRMKSRAKAN